MEQFRRRKSYTTEFKLSAIRLYEQGGTKLRDLEKDLGISSGSLSHWRSDFASGKFKDSPGKDNQPPESPETARLRRQLEMVTEERNILKKAIGIFSTPSR